MYFHIAHTWIAFCLIWNTMCLSTSPLVVFFMPYINKCALLWLHSKKAFHDTTHTGATRLQVSKEYSCLYILECSFWMCIHCKSTKMFLVETECVQLFSVKPFSHYLCWNAIPEYLASSLYICICITFVLCIHVSKEYVLFFSTWIYIWDRRP